MKRQSRTALVDTLLQSIREEYADELRSIASGYTTFFPDPTPAERVQIDILIHSQWMWNCLNRDLALEEAPDPHSEAFSREFYLALNELLRLRAARRDAASAPQDHAAFDGPAAPQVILMSHNGSHKWVM